MVTEVSYDLLKKALGHKVEVVAFGIAYRGKLKKLNPKVGTIEIVDRNNSAVLEIERIESFEELKNH